MNKRQKKKQRKKKAEKLADQLMEAFGIALGQARAEFYEKLMNEKGQALDLSFIL